MKWIPLMIKCTILLWLACFISLILTCMREYYLNITWIIMNLSYVRCCLLFLINPFDSFNQASPMTLDYHFHVGLPSTLLVHPTLGRPGPSLGRSDLSKNHSWHSLEWLWLIDQTMDLSWWKIFTSFFKSFSFFLSLILIFQLSAKSVTQYLSCF